MTSLFFLDAINWMIDDFFFRSQRHDVSIGFVEYPLFRDSHGAPDWQRMVELADRALYTVKHDGRNGWATYRPAYPMRVEDLLAELDHARAVGGGLPHGVELHRSPKAS